MRRRRLVQNDFSMQQSRVAAIVGPELIVMLL